MSDEEALPWDEVENAAKKMFTLWGGDGELAWAKEAWMHLSAAGLTANYSLEDLTRTQLRLVTLAYVYDRFCDNAWEESWQSEPYLFAEHIDLSPLGLGILYGRLQPEVDDWEESTIFAEAVEAVCLSLKDEIHDCLVQAYGGNHRLFARLWNTRDEELEEDDTDGSAFDVEPDNLVGFDYVQQGFSD